jgi:proteasome lid subunit RPN8/RPN11
MWQTLVRTSRQWFQRAQRVFVPDRPTPVRPHAPFPPTPTLDVLSLERVVLTEGVSQSLFEDFAAHRATTRGQEETGWTLIGHREGNAAVVMATLPAGAERDAGVAHVRFNSTAQEVGSRILRQKDKRLQVLGVAHTHPGSLRRPSDGDWSGDSQWVKQLRGHEGVFAIGTAEGPEATNGSPHEEELDGLFFSWYALKQGDAQYRPLGLDVTPGPDVARVLHPVWDAIEVNAERLDRLFRQQYQLVCDVVTTAQGPALVVHVRLAETSAGMRVLIRGRHVRYFLVRGSDVLASDLSEPRVDVGVYTLLAELAKKA